MQGAPILLALAISASSFHAETLPSPAAPAGAQHYSIVLNDKTHYGAVSDLSLSGGQSNFSVDIWVKVLSNGGNDATSIAGTQDQQGGTGGWAIDLYTPTQGYLADTVAWTIMNTGFANSFIDSHNNGANWEYGIISAPTTLNDGNWHEITIAYNGDILPNGAPAPSVSAVTDGTHLTVNDTTGISNGDYLSQTYYQTTVTSVIDGTHLQVANTTGFVTGYVYIKGVLIYVDGTLIPTPFKDYDIVPLNGNYNSTLKFAIGDPQQTVTHTVLAKYAYPTLYNRTLSPTEVATLAGHGQVSGAAAQWLFTEGTGVTAADSSGNGHTLTFNAVDAWDTDVPF